MSTPREPARVPVPTLRQLLPPLALVATLPLLGLLNALPELPGLWAWAPLVSFLIVGLVLLLLGRRLWGATLVAYAVLALPGAILVAVIQARLQSSGWHWPPDQNMPFTGMPLW